LKCPREASEFSEALAAAVKALPRLAERLIPVDDEENHVEFAKAVLVIQLNLQYMNALMNCANYIVVSDCHSEESVDIAFMSILNFNPHLLLMSQSRISYCSFYFAQL
jgi:hypothetical protein